MGDELDDIIDPQEPNAQVDTPDEADQITLSKAEVERLRADADSGKEALAQSKRLEQSLTDLQATVARGAAPPQQKKNVEIDWSNPGESIAALTEERIKEIAAPYARQTAENIANMSILTFRSQKASNPFFGPASVIFDREIAGLDKGWLGSLPTDTLQSTLNKAWSVAVGEYVETEQRKRKKDAPPNLGGGGGKGGGGKIPGTKTSLSELDPIAYRWAQANGLSEEDMQDIANGIEA